MARTINSRDNGQVFKAIGHDVDENRKKKQSQGDRAESSNNEKKNSCLRYCLHVHMNSAQLNAAH